MRYLLLLSLSISCLAQTQGNAPQANDGYMDASQMNGGAGSCGFTNNCVNFVDGVGAQDLIVCGATQNDATGGACTGSNPPWTFSDSASDTWTSNTSANPPLSDYFIQTAYACTTASHTTFTVTRAGNGNCAAAMHCVRYSNACSAGSVTVDAFQSNINSISASGITNVHNSVTTTKLNDLIVSFLGQAGGNGGSNRINPTGSLGEAAGNSFGDPNSAWQIAPSIGSNNYGWAEVVAQFRDDVEQTIAFSVPIKIGDSVPPQAVLSNAYKAQLHCYGGTSSTPTFALASGALPTGLTLHAATGVIDGTPTVAGTTAGSYTCSDGTNTSTAQSLPITVGGGSTITQVGSALVGTLNGFNPANLVLSQAVCGDILTFFTAGVDTHGGEGYLQDITGPNNQVSSSDNAPVQRYQLNAGIWPAPLVEWIVGPFLGSSPTVTIKNGTAASSGLVYFGKVLRGAQALLDTPVVNSAVISTSSTPMTISYTTVVPNEYLQMAAVTPNSAAGYTFTSPLTLDNTNAAFISGAAASTLVASPSTIAAQVTETETAGSCGSFTNCNFLSAMVTAVRPGAPPASCNAFTEVGEKHRRINN